MILLRRGNMSELKINLSFREYTFELDKTDCKRCMPARWLIVANYDYVYFPLAGDTYDGLEKGTFKVKVASYKNLKDAKRALRLRRFKDVVTTFQEVP
jgi:hypothetical protein